MKFADESRDPADARGLVKPIIELVHGPGCPVRVIPMGRVNDAIWLAGRPDVIVFGTASTPQTPIRTCMVSPEGACAAYYNFGRLHRETAALIGQPQAAVHG